MKMTPQITFRNLPHSDAVEDHILDKIETLEKYFDKITSCRVVVERPHHNHHKGNLYHVRIDLRIPGSELVVNRDPEKHHQNEDMYVAIRDAFSAITRQLKAHVARRRHHVKHHVEPVSLGRIATIVDNNDYGFISTDGDREIYFHRNALMNGDFDKLESGRVVQFVEEQGEDGPQASTVYVVE